ncbi:MAG TPA: hypothetical protein VMC41_04725 [Candidatus Nanoarchaeia archaeon]|nr:hypothetical protein [Candidatus Nanoarchaeia archaeon]
MFFKVFCLATIVACLNCFAQDAFIHHSFEFSHESDSSYTRASSVFVNADHSQQICVDMLQLTGRESAAKLFNASAENQYGVLKGTLLAHGWKISNGNSATKSADIRVGWEMRHDGVFYTDEGFLYISNSNRNQLVQTTCRVYEKSDDTGLMAAILTAIGKL